MVIDNLMNACFYKGLGERLSAALKYLKETDFSSMEPGKYEIDQSNVFALVQRYESKQPETGKWEGHRKYIDIQYVAEGSERMGYANITRMKAIRQYDVEKDFILFKGEGDYFSAVAGSFAIFTPQDAHMTGIMTDKPQMVKKVVIKVRV